MQELCVGKGKRTCTNCLPSRRGKCSNTKQLVASTSAPPTSGRNLPSHVAVADATPNTSTPSNIDIHTLSHTLSAAGQSPYNAHPPTSQGSTAPTTPIQPMLPDYPPVMPPSFTWGSVSGTDFSRLLDSNLQ